MQRYYRIIISLFWWNLQLFDIGKYMEASQNGKALSWKIHLQMNDLRGPPILGHLHINGHFPQRPQIFSGAGLPIPVQKKMNEAEVAAEAEGKEVADPVDRGGGPWTLSSGC